MGWVWQDDDDDNNNNNKGEINEFEDVSPRSEARCSTRKIISSQCRTEEVEPGKFIKKCEKTEQLLNDCVGRQPEVIQSNKEYTEEDVTDQMKNGSLSSQATPFDFPGLRSDIEAIERNLFGNMNRFFEAAEDMKNEFFNMFGPPHLYDRDLKSSSPSFKQGVPIEPPSPPPAKVIEPEMSDGHVDLSGLARDV
ncbi:fra a 1-associated protein-like [Bidens hawaiensis]|uniref:fra a 1-associated protein-like n=1 Tax=Bidens hawaiensis TaxID=980011 RepID=UPI00404AE4D7